MTFYQLHPDIGMNFQMNRVLTYGEQAGCLTEIREIAARIHTYADWYLEWFGLAQRLEQNGRFLHAANAYRMAEFFLTDSQVEKEKCYLKFKQCFYQAVDSTEFAQVAIPYQGKSLPAMYFPAVQEKGVLIVHGGYDSFIEEFYLTVRDIPKKGYTVILFEGPGQGGALKQGLTFTHAWENPVTAVLDHFNLQNAALLGISWGGYLALRAAAYEPRIAQVIAYDVCFDGLEVLLRPMPVVIRSFMRFLVHMDAQYVGNALIDRLRRKSLLLDWAVGHGMIITGTHTPIDFYRHIAQHTMRDVSEMVQQDVLLLAGEKDHYIPVRHLYRQEKALARARSITTRLFTTAEGGEQHCQVGNHQLAVDTILAWLGQFY